MSQKEPPSTEELLELLKNRTLPSNEEAERGVVSCLLQEPATRLPRCLVELHPLAFYHLVPRVIYTHLLNMYVDEVPVDVVTLSTYLRNAGDLERVGGGSAVSELYTFVPIAAHFDYYIKVIHASWLRRKLVRAGCEDILSALEFGKDAPDADPKRLIVEAEGRLTDLHPKSSRGGLQHVSKYIPDALGEIETAYSNRGHVTRGIATGFTDLDRATMGIEPGLFVLAARPSKGKTVFALQVAMNIGLGRGDYRQFEQPALSVGIWSLETEAARLTRRMLCNLAEINLGRARDGMLSRKKMEDTRSQAVALGASNIYLESCFGLTIQEFRAKARHAVKKHGLRVIIVDYLQLLKSSSRAAMMNRQNEMIDVSTGLKAMAHELAVPVIALAQINRDGDVARPRMSDIKDSGQIEQDADYVAILCDAEGIEDVVETEDEISIDLSGNAWVGLDVVKLKEGKTTTDGAPIKLKFDKEYFRMLSTTFDFMSNNEDKRQH